MKSIARPDILAALITRLESLTPATPRRWGTLTSNEMLCHLADSARIVLANGWDVVEEKGGTNRPGPIIKLFALRLPFPWSRTLRTHPAIDQRTHGTKPVDFEGDRRRAVDGLRALAAATTLPPVHPYIGPMTREDWLRWAYRHTDHHLRQFGV